MTTTTSHDGHGKCTHIKGTIGHDDRAARPTGGGKRSGGSTEFVTVPFRRKRVTAAPDIHGVWTAGEK
jgi:hypothetical protein